MLSKIYYPAKITTWLRHYRGHKNVQHLFETLFIVVYIQRNVRISNVGGVQVVRYQ